MSLSTQSKSSKKTDLRQLIIFALLGVIMFLSKILMEALPNVHLLGALTITYTLVYRWRALIPLYIYVLLNGLFAGFDAWWVPYLYIWTVLWAAAMLLPKKMPKPLACVVYPLLCALHGAAFGILYAPAWAIIMKLDFKETIAWVIAGVPFDVMHIVGNAVAGLLIFPLSELLKRLESRYRR